MTIGQDNTVELPTKLDIADPFAVPAPENASLPGRAEITLSMQPAHIQPEQIRCGSLAAVSVPAHYQIHRYRFIEIISKLSSVITQRCGPKATNICSLPASRAALTLPRSAWGKFDFAARADTRERFSGSQLILRSKCVTLGQKMRHSGYSLRCSELLIRAGGNSSLLFHLFSGEVAYFNFVQHFSMASFFNAYRIIRVPCFETCKNQTRVLLITSLFSATYPNLTTPAGTAVG